MPKDEYHSIKALVLPDVRSYHIVDRSVGYGIILQIWYDDNVDCSDEDENILWGSEWGQG